MKLAGTVGQGAATAADAKTTLVFSKRANTRGVRTYQFTSLASWKAPSDIKTEKSYGRLPP
jgi:hypothetical protein